MTQDEIIEMARQVARQPDKIYAPDEKEFLYYFAKLVEKKVHNDASTYMLKIHNDWFCVKKQGDKHD